MQSPLVNLILVDDHPLVGRSLAHYLQSVRPEMKIVVLASFEELGLYIEYGEYPKIIVVDLWLSKGNVLSDLVRFRAHHPTTSCLVMSGDADISIPQRVRDAGAQGFIPKQSSPEQFTLAIDAIVQGGVWFPMALATEGTGDQEQRWEVTPSELGITSRQGEILNLLIRGLPNKRIASALGVAESTVKEHVTGIFERLGVRNRIEVITLINQRRIKVR
jgi:DNA-binding NarL/FixJ family response regulator